MRRIAIDSNLLLLLLIGLTSKKMIEQHKRLRNYTVEDFDLLVEFIGKSELITTPNVLTEVSNLARYRINGQWRDDITTMFSLLINKLTEQYLESQAVVKTKNFSRLGLADTAWLCILKQNDILLTDDLDLYLAALTHKIDARNFTHIREQNGTI